MAQPAAPDKRPVVRGVVTALLVIAVGGTLVVPIYARSLPKLGAFPFFYWYQLAWVPVAAILCWLCYILLRTKPAPAAGPINAGPLNASPINGGPGDSGGRQR